MTILCKHISFFLLALAISFSCTKKGTEPKLKRPATLVGKLHCYDQPAPDVEVLVLEYKPDYDTLGADTSQADSGYFFIDDLPADTVNIIYNDILFTGPLEDYFSFKRRFILEKGENQLGWWYTYLTDTLYIDQWGRPLYLLDRVMAEFDPTIDSIRAEEIVSQHGSRIVSRYSQLGFSNITDVSVPEEKSAFEMIKELNFDFQIKGAYPETIVYGKVANISPYVHFPSNYKPLTKEGRSR